MPEPAPHYSDIFRARGAQYQQAMALCPRARRRELELVVETAGVQAGHVVCDVPAGGGYLHECLPARAYYLAVEPARAFVRPCALRAGVHAVRGAIERLPLRSACVDRLISLAALHHVWDKQAFYAEAWRVLRPGGVLALADVAARSPVAEFLNVFVDRHNPDGHRGDFLDEAAAAQLGNTGWAVDAVARRAFSWEFGGVAEMARFCALLFGIQTSARTIARGLAGYLGYRRGRTGCRLNWELLFVRARKARRAHAAA